MNQGKLGGADFAQFNFQTCGLGFRDHNLGHAMNCSRIVGGRLAFDPGTDPLGERLGLGRGGGTVESWRSGGVHIDPCLKWLFVILFKRYSISEVTNGIWQLSRSQTNGPLTLFDQRIGGRTV